MRVDLNSHLFCEDLHANHQISSASGLKFLVKITHRKTSAELKEEYKKYWDWAENLFQKCGLREIKIQGKR